MKNLNILKIIGIVIIIAGAGFFFSNKNLSPLNSLKESTSPQESVKKEAVLVIDSGDGLPQTFQVEFQEGMTAFDLLRNKTEELNIALKTKTYDIGIFIEAVGNKENGQDGKYWMYYVNGEMPMVAADKKEIKAGDKVEFKFEKSPF